MKKRTYLLWAIIIVPLLFLSASIIKNNVHYDVYQYDEYGNRVSFLYTTDSRPDSWTANDEYKTSQFTHAAFEYNLVVPGNLILEKGVNAFSPYLWAGGIIIIIIIVIIFYFIFHQKTIPTEKLKDAIKLPPEIVVILKDERQKSGKP